jgi:hypothetical protein
MPKFVGQGTITDHKGLARLKTFCANSTPFLICRDETVTDVGIDGEIEITLKNSDGKTEATNERIKFQLKSTESTESYIRDESDDTFKFYAKPDDVGYWTRHKQGVLLIIYDARIGKLYGKRITENDRLSQKQNKKSYPLTFYKKSELLDENNFNFHSKYSESTRNRMSFDLHEPAISNLFRVRKHPKVIYAFDTDFTKKESVYKSVPRKGVKIPEFALYDKTIYTFVPLERLSGHFRKAVIKADSKRVIRFEKVASDRALRNHFVELIKIYVRKFLGTKGIFLNREHNRFYFGIRPNEGHRSIFARTRKRGRKTPKEVVKYYNYGKYSFFRHHAFTLEYVHGENLYLCVTPTYLLTVDGKLCVDGKTAAKFIVPQKAREFNPQVADKIHMVFSFLSGDKEDIAVLNEDGITIEISSYIPLTLPFSIPLDDKGFPQYLKKRRARELGESQRLLFQ